jgi:hypothetical protein
VFDRNHKEVHLFDAQAQKLATVALNSAPEMRGHEVYHPRWTGQPELFVVTGPYDGDKSKGGAEIDIYLGRLDPAFNSVAEWFRVTDDSLADLYPDVWVGP